MAVTPKQTYPKRTTLPHRIDFSPRDWENLIEDHGTQIRITPTLLCPRISGDAIERGDNNHDLNCPLCHGRLTIDLAEEAFQTEAFIQGIKLDKNFDASSRFDVKDCTITFHAVDKINYWYKIEVIDFSSLYNETLLRRNGDTDKIRYSSVLPDDNTYYLCVDSEGVRYVIDIDFSITGNELTWLTANRPEEKKLYSVLYPILPTLRVLELLHETRFYYDSFKSPVKTPVTMPQQAHCRWDYMFQRGNNVQP